MEADESLDQPDTEGSGRRLSFIGTLNSGAGDLAERHEEILREGLNRPV
ncbi:hypothetical protein [Sphaerisporangium sp. NPDC051011]